MPKERSLNLYNYKTFLLYNFLFLRKSYTVIAFVKASKKNWYQWLTSIVSITCNLTLLPDRLLLQINIYFN